MAAATVLVVDDVAHIRNRTARICRRAGYNVLTADDGHTALQVASAHKPDVLLLDIVMPTIDGFEVLRELRARKIVTRVILLTAFNFKPQQIVECGRFGAYAFLSSSVDKADLLATIDRALTLSGTLNVEVAEDVSPVLAELATKVSGLQQQNYKLQGQLERAREQADTRTFVLAIVACVLAGVTASAAHDLGIVTDSIFLVVIWGMTFGLLLLAVLPVRRFFIKTPAVEAEAELDSPE